MRLQKSKKLKSIINEYKIIKKEITTPKFIKSEAYNFTLNNGATITRERIIKGFKDGSAVIIVPYIDDEIMIVIEPRVFTKSGIGIGFPAGYIEPLEDPKEAALRELREETGLVPEKLEELDSFYQDEGCSSAYNHIFVAYNCKKVYEQDLDKDELVNYMTVTEDELEELEQNGLIEGANSKLAIQKILRKR